MNKAAVESDANQHDINKWFPLKIIGERKRIIYIFMPIFSDCHADCHNNHYDSQYFIKYEIWHSNPAKAPRTAPGINAMAMYKLCLMSL